MIQIHDLNKSYGKLQVLKDINLELDEGKIYGLLGRNGVGKTTLLNLISNKLKGDSGEVKVSGEEVFENEKMVEDIVMIGETRPEFEDLKVKEIFQIASILYKNWNEEYRKFLCKKFKVEEDKKYKKLSKGNRTIIGLILGLASRSRITLFDEPSSGLDAAYRDEFYKLLLEDFERYPRTIIISTHLIDEVANLFEEVIILKDKKVFIQDEVENLIENSYYVNGKDENVDRLLGDKKIIHREEFGANTILGIFDKFTLEEKRILIESNVEISKIPLQKLFIYLTDSGEGENNG